ncbi:hypothetical protein MNEG_16463, partial [Monoraphidium neglectum]
RRRGAVPVPPPRAPGGGPRPRLVLPPLPQRRDRGCGRPGGAAGGDRGAGLGSGSA